MEDKKFTVDVSGGYAEHLQYLAKSQGITPEEAIKKAIATESYLLQKRKKGAKILVFIKDQDYIGEVIFKGMLLLDKPEPATNLNENESVEVASSLLNTLGKFINKLGF